MSNVRRCSSSSERSMQSNATAVAILMAFSTAVASAQTCPIPPEVNPKRIVPVVRSAAGVEASFPKSPRTVPTRRLNDELTIVYAEDTKGAIAYFLIEEAEAKCWQSNDEVLNQSFENLPSALGRLRVVELESDLYMIAVGGNYEASLILLGQTLRRFAPKAAGDLVIGVPNRDLLLVTGRQNLNAVNSLRERVARFHANGERPLSDKVFILMGNDLRGFNERP
jgi:uncharacterized protein YtpQ (UPF0354 family)